MELKDVILSTLAEMDTVQESGKEDHNEHDQQTAPQEAATQSNMDDQTDANASEEVLFLESVRERLLVLFEGFQSPNNSQIEAKVDLTLNFLEYLLSSIDTRLDKIK